MPPAWLTIGWSLNLTTERQVAVCDGCCGGGAAVTAATALCRRIDCGGGGVEDIPVVGEVLVGDASDVIDGSSLMVTVVRVWEKDTQHDFGLFPFVAGWSEAAIAAAAAGALPLPLEAPGLGSVTAVVVVTGLSCCFGGWVLLRVAARFRSPAK